MKEYIDDKIREGKRKGQTDFYWSPEEWQELNYFFEANAPCVHGWFCLCGEGSKEYTDKYCVEGMTFMGAKHFISHLKEQIKE